MTNIISPIQACIKNINYVQAEFCDLSLNLKHEFKRSIIVLGI